LEPEFRVDLDFDELLLRFEPLADCLLPDRELDFFLVAILCPPVTMA